MVTPAAIPPSPLVPSDVASSKLQFGFCKCVCSEFRSPSAATCVPNSHLSLPSIDGDRTQRRPTDLLHRIKKVRCRRQVSARGGWRGPGGARMKLPRICYCLVINITVSPDVSASTRRKQYGQIKYSDGVLSASIRAGGFVSNGRII